MPSDLQVSNIKDQANANSAITIASDGQITVNQNNPTLTLGSNATFPQNVTDKTYFFPVERAGVIHSSYGNYRTSALTSSNPTRTTAFVPSETATVVGAYFCWIPATNDTFRLALKISANSNSEAFNSNTLSATVFADNVSRTGDNVYIENMFSISAISTFFSSNISANDVLGFEVEHQSGGNANDLGILLTFRF